MVIGLRFDSFRCLWQSHNSCANRTRNAFTLYSEMGKQLLSLAVASLEGKHPSHRWGFWEMNNAFALHIVCYVICIHSLSHSRVISLVVEWIVVRLSEGQKWDVCVICKYDNIFFLRSIRWFIYEPRSIIYHSVCSISCLLLSPFFPKINRFFTFLSPWIFFKNWGSWKKVIK